MQVYGNRAQIKSLNPDLRNFDLKYWYYRFHQN